MNIITIGLILTSVILVALVLLQDRSSGVGGAFGGGGGGGGNTQKRRGAEKVLFNATIVIVIIFASLAIWNLLSHQQRDARISPQPMEDEVDIEFGEEGVQFETTPMEEGAESAPVEGEDVEEE